MKILALHSLTVSAIMFGAALGTLPANYSAASTASQTPTSDSESGSLESSQEEREQLTGEILPDQMKVMMNLIKDIPEDIEPVVVELRSQLSEKNLATALTILSTRLMEIGRIEDAHTVGYLALSELESTSGKKGIGPSEQASIFLQMARVNQHVLKDPISAASAAKSARDFNGKLSVGGRLEADIIRTGPKD